MTTNSDNFIYTRKRNKCMPNILINYNFEENPLYFAEISKKLDGYTGKD